MKVKIEVPGEVKNFLESMGVDIREYLESRLADLYPDRLLRRRARASAREGERFAHTHACVWLPWCSRLNLDPSGAVKCV
jgi:hypothetical protein